MFGTSHDQTKLVKCRMVIKARAHTMVKIIPDGSKAGKAAAVAQGRSGEAPYLYLAARIGVPGWPPVLRIRETTAGMDHVTQTSYWLAGGVQTLGMVESGRPIGRTNRPCRNADRRRAGVRSARRCHRCPADRTDAAVPACFNSGWCHGRPDIAGATHGERR